jgi:hypothetical protein
VAAAELTVIWWRDVPLQVTAAEGRRSVRRQLSDRFEKAVDAAAMRAGLVGSDDYLEHFRKERRPCGDDLEQEVEAEVARLEAEFTPAVLRELIRAGGAADPA